MRKILPTIGGIVIVMSEYYWNEYVKYFIDEELYRDTLKYHQKTLYKEKVVLPMISQKKELLQTYKVKTSDIKYLEKPVSSLDTNIKRVFFSLKERYTNLDAIVSIPVIVITNKNMGIDAGAYSTEFTDGKLIPVKVFSEIELIEIIKIFSEKDLIIAFFINIEQAIALYGKKGYCKGIEEIGYLSYSIKKEFNVATDYVMIPEQKFTHDVGVNLRKCLFIDGISLNLESTNDIC